MSKQEFVIEEARTTRKYQQAHEDIRAEPAKAPKNEVVKACPAFLETSK